MGNGPITRTSSEIQIMRVSIDGGKPEVVPGTSLAGRIPWHASDWIFPATERWLTVMFVKTVEMLRPVPVVALVDLDAGAKPLVRMLNPDPRISGAPGFTPDEKALVYNDSSRTALENLWLQPLDGSTGRQITNFHDGCAAEFRLLARWKDARECCERSCGIGCGAAAR